MIQKIYNEIKKTKIIQNVDKSIVMQISDEQKASLFCLAIIYSKTDNSELKNFLLENNPWLSKYENIINAEKDSLNQSDGIEAVIISKTFHKQEFYEEQINKFVQGFTNGFIPLTDVSFWCMLICERGLSEENTYLLTQAMVKSGNVYDYKFHFPNSFFTRRYPTGAVSEKLALLLPTMLMSIAKEYDIKSPFTVARSLGFTGGTWDKMSTIPGFEFPEPGLKSVETLQKCNVSMTVSKDDMCPADRILYQLRSLTGTVESVELIAASITSKQLVIPCDYLVLDTRYGEGAFFEKKEAAANMATLVQKFLIKSGMSVDINYTDTPFPNGSSIGNALEVEEAIYILTGVSNIRWNEAGIQNQKKLLFHFLSLIMQKITGNKSFDATELGEKFIKDGTAKRNFSKLLKAHKVSDQVIEDIFKHTFAEVIGLKKANIDLISEKDFILNGINQRDLGNLINFELGGARYEFGVSERSLNGLLIYHHLGEQVKKGDTIFSIYSTSVDTIIDKKERILSLLQQSVY